MKSLLIITYYWPPASSPGVYRFLKFCKYLPDFGWRPVVLTVRNGSYPAYDPSLLKEIPEGLKVYKTPTIEPFALFNRLSGKKGKSVPVEITPSKTNTSLLNRLMFWIRANWFIPDARIGWKWFAVNAAIKIIQSEKIDAVISTGPPHSTHLTGLALKKKTGIPWIADFRDPWTNIFYNEHFPRTPRTIEKDKKLEDTVAATADAVVVISNGLNKEFRERARRIETIHNGFDTIDMPCRTNEKTPRFVMTYIGNMPANRNIPMVWQALAELKNELKNFSKNFTLMLIGSIDQTAIDDLQAAGIGDIINIRSYIPHDEAVRIMSNTNMLYFMINQAKNNSLIITGKLFEYLASCAPMVSVGPADGDAAKLIEEAGREKMIEYSNKDGFKSVVSRYYNQWMQTRQLEVLPCTQIEQFSRKELTKKLAALLDSLVLK